MIEITSMDHNGRGIGKLNNKIVFVKNALPGEIVNLKILKEKKNFIEAEVLSYIKKAENRIESVCPYYLECGGCDLLHLNYNDQLKFKQDKINNIINRYLDTKITINDIVKCDDNFNYRNKVSFQVKEKIGFYNDKTYEIIPIKSCLIANNIINDSIKYLNKLDLKNISKIICRTGNNKLMIILESTTLDIDITSLKEIADLPDVSEGLEHAIKNAANSCNTLVEFMNIIKTKRYTNTRIQRILLYALLGITKNDMKASFKAQPYIRVLGMNNKGKELLSVISSSNPNLNIITSVKKYIDSNPNKNLLNMLNIDINATNIYTLGYQKDSWSNLDFTHNMIIY